MTGISPNLVHALDLRKREEICMTDKPNFYDRMADRGWPREVVKKVFIGAPYGMPLSDYQLSIYNDGRFLLANEPELMVENFLRPRMEEGENQAAS